MRKRLCADKIQLFFKAQVTLHTQVSVFAGRAQWFGGCVEEVGTCASANTLCLQAGRVGLVCLRRQAFPLTYTLSLINSPVVTD